MPTVRTIIMLFAVCALTCACQSAETPTTAGNAANPRHVSAEEVKRIGQKYLDEHAPQWADEYKLPSRVVDHADYWEYTFALPAGMIGGTPVVYIDKRTLQVTKMFHEQ